MVHAFILETPGLTALLVGRPGMGPLPIESLVRVRRRYCRSGLPNPLSLPCGSVSGPCVLLHMSICPSLHCSYVALITLFWVLSQELVWLYRKPRPWDSILVIPGTLLICVTFRVRWFTICSHTHLCTCGIAFWSALGWICRLSWETCHLSVIEFSNPWTSHSSPFIYSYFNVFHNDCILF